MSYKVCGLHGLLPRSLQIPLCYEPSGTPHAHGGFADVWKGEHLGEKVAAKTLRVSEQTDFNQIRQVRSSVPGVLTNTLTASTTEILQGGHNMEEP